jgi:hypothetical protein
MSFRRALLSLVISLSVTWVVALGCIEGVARKDGVFLRTSKAGGRRNVLRALRLTQVEAVLAVALFAAAGFLAASGHGPWLLIFIIVFQGCVYLCGPIASVWNLWAQGIPGHEFRRRFQERRLHAERHRRPWARLPRPAAAALTALCVGGVTSAFLPPVPLLHTTAAPRPAASLRSLLAGTDAYLKLGSPTSNTVSAYYPVTSVHLSTASGQVGLSFDTSSLVLLGKVLRAGANGVRIRGVSLAIRAPGPGRPTTELVDTFAAADVTYFQEHLSGVPTGSVSLVLRGARHVISAPGTLRRVGPFAGLSGPAAPSATKAYVYTDAGGRNAPSYAVTTVELMQAASGAPLDLSFTTSSLPLLDEIFRHQRTAAGIPVLTLAIGANGGGHLFATALTYRFSGLNVGSFEENLSGPISGAATLVVGPR